MPDPTGSDVAPERTDAVASWVISMDTAAEIAFLAAVFDVHEQPGSRVTTDDGAIAHVEVELQGFSLLMFDAAPQWPRTPSHLRVYVDDVRKVVAAAEELGAVVVTVPTTSPFGDVVARFRDPQGHRWWVHQHVEDIDADTIQQRLADPEHHRTLDYIEQSLRAEMAN